MGATPEAAGGAVRVWQIDGDAWETEAAVDPVGEALPLGEWLASLPEERLTLKVLPISRIAGGPCDGGHVLLAEAWADRLYFAVPPAAVPALAGHLPPAEYDELVRRTPALWGAG
ncbi:MAG: hypothetical protein M3Q65_02120 [Chloroflexota bacterium]|nr:hypothetical protein [Chloroflexota bacterium]